MDITVNEEMGDRASPESQRRLLESMLKDRQVIVKFKKGGRWSEDHVYGSADLENPEAIDALKRVMALAPRQNDGGVERVVLSSKMIGMGFSVGPAPWEMKQFREIAAAGPTAEQKFAFNTPIRVSDVIEQPGTVIVEFESV